MQTHEAIVVLETGNHTISATRSLPCCSISNPSREEDGGRLRLLRRPGDIEDFAAERPIGNGVMLKCSDNARHGHKLVGE